jgi:polar amino acid transport system substrate-binding protein
MTKFHKTILLLALSFYSHISFSSELLKFTTLDWPPYLSKNLPQEGFGVEILKQAFKAEGYDNIQVNFLPWSRALALVEEKGEYIGCLLAYYSKERAEKFIYSDSVISGPIQFAMRNDNIIKWGKLEELKNHRIGIVQDYVNSPELDQLIASKKLLADPSVSDANNLLKLASKRIDLAVVDTNVFTYLLKTSPPLKAYKDQLQISPKVLDEKKLYILFSKSEKGQKFADIFNKGLKKINPAEIAKKYIEKI